MRRRRQGLIDDADRDRALAGVDRDLAAMLVVELAPVVVDRAMSVLRRHALRAEDAMQLASYLHLRDALGEESTFVAFDERLVGAARKERVRVV